MVVLVICCPDLGVIGYWLVVVPSYVVVYLLILVSSPKLLRFIFVVETLKFYDQENYFVEILQCRLRGVTV